LSAGWIPQYRPSILSNEKYLKEFREGQDIKIEKTLVVKYEI